MYPNPALISVAYCALIQECLESRDAGACPATFASTATRTLYASQAARVDYYCHYYRFLLLAEMRAYSRLRVCRAGRGVPLSAARFYFPLHPPPDRCACVATALPSSLSIKIGESSMDQRWIRKGYLIEYYRRRVLTRPVVYHSPHVVFATHPSFLIALAV